MARFLDTAGVSHFLQQLINKADERLVLISPYLKIIPRIKDALEDKNRLKIDIRVVYGKNELQPEENNWLKSMSSIRTSFCKDLHAKCYLNENEVIITSMNLYEFSHVNNHEMGIYINKNEDPDLYKDIYDEVQRLIRISEEFIFSVERPSIKETQPEVIKSKNKISGYCIRTGTEIPFNVEKPMSYDAFRSWNKFGDPDYREKFCHFTGEPSNGETSVNKPILKKNWKLAKNVSAT